MRLRYLFVLILLLSFGIQHQLSAQCASHEAEVVVTIIPDNFPNETSWELTDASGAVLGSASGAQGGTVVNVGTPSAKHFAQCPGQYTD